MRWHVISSCGNVETTARLVSEDDIEVEVSPLDGPSAPWTEIESELFPLLSVLVCTTAFPVLMIR